MFPDSLFSVVRAIERSGASVESATLHRFVAELWSQRRGDTTYATQKELADASELSPPTVNQYIALLRKFGALENTPRHGRYTFTDAVMQDDERSEHNVQQESAA